MFALGTKTKPCDFPFFFFCICNHRINVPGGNLFVFCIIELFAICTQHVCMAFAAHLFWFNFIEVVVESFTDRNNTAREVSDERSQLTLSHKAKGSHPISKNHSS